MSGRATSPWPTSGVGTAMMKASAGSITVVARSFAAFHHAADQCIEVGFAEMRAALVDDLDRAGIDIHADHLDAVSAKTAAVGRPI